MGLIPPDAVALLRAGGLAILPTDTVYGIACAGYLRTACARLYAVKQRPPEQPTSLVLGSVENLLENVLPELMGRVGIVCRRAFPGPWTLVVPNPAHRFAYVCGSDPGKIGVRVPELTAQVAELSDAVGGLVMASANLRGEPAPARLKDVPAALREVADFEVDGGELGGTPSAVIDVTGSEPVILRGGPRAAEALARIGM
jgi:tRNA threonylcarbamoyl adenosine modification protein (Sua5/YciO/YrdC/YwlC family)